MPHSNQRLISDRPRRAIPGRPGKKEQQVHIRGGEAEAQGRPIETEEGKDMTQAFGDQNIVVLFSPGWSEGTK